MKRKEIVMIILVSFFTIYIIAYSWYKAINKQQNSDNSIIYNREVEIFIYGSDIVFDSSISVRYIHELSEKMFENIDDSNYTFLIINDLNDEVKLLDTDIEIIDKEIENNKIGFFYLGTTDIDKIKEAEIFVQPLLDYDMSLGVVYERNIRTEVLGTWNIELNNEYINGDVALLSDVLINEIENIIMYNEK